MSVRYPGRSRSAAAIALLSAHTGTPAAERLHISIDRAYADAQFLGHAEA